MLTNNESIQRLWIMDAASRVRASVWGTFHQVEYYFSLRSTNDELAQENAMLREKIRLYDMQDDAQLQSELKWGGIPASIIKMSTNSLHNYIIINKGSEDGIKPQSGIISSKGVVGVIDGVTKHMAYGITLMNTAMNISARMGHDGSTGQLSWDGVHTDGAILKALPLQTKFEKGDTVWTSGFSALFPPDVPIGIVSGHEIIDGVNLEIGISLFQDFSSLKYVTVMDNGSLGEITDLEIQEGGN